MIFDRLRSREGFTLIELLLFSVIFALVTVAFVGIFIVVTRIQSRENSTISIQQESQFFIQKVQALIQQSSLIEMTTDLSTSTIKLRMASSVSDPTYIYVSSSRAFLLETATGTPQPLTSDRVSISDVSFIKRSNPRGYDSLKISFLISAQTTGTDVSSTQRISTSISRTAPATFDSDFETQIGQSISLGTALDHIGSINSTLFFRGGKVGISANGETPKQLLQIDNGGLKFSSLPTRPTCTLALQGTLWFRQDDVNGDTTAICMKSTTGPYYWTGDLPDDFTPIAVDGPVGGQVGSSENVGQYTSIAALTPTIGASTTLYVSYFNNSRKSLMFVKSTSSGSNWFGRIEVHYTGTTSGIGHDNSITAPTTSTIFMSYYNQNNPGLWFASSSNHGDDWGSKSIVTGSGEGQYTSVASHGTNNIYISYFGGSSDLMFARSTNGGSTFSINPIDTSGVTGKYTSMRAVGTSTLYILYFGGGNLKLVRSDDSGGSWSSPVTVASGLSDVGRGNDIATVSPSTVFVIYYDQSGSNSLRFNSSTNYGVAGSWGTSQQVLTNVSRHMSIATPDGTTLFVGYQSTAGTNGYGVIRSFNKGSTWSVNEIKDSGGSTGEYNAMAATDASVFATYWNNNGSNYQLKSFRSLYPRLFDD